MTMHALRLHLPGLPIPGRSIVLLGLFLALLTGANLLPDPCDGCADRCCTSAATDSDCHTPCCVGMPAAPEGTFRLDLPTEVGPVLQIAVLTPEFTPPDPLIRPPIAA